MIKEWDVFHGKGVSRWKSAAAKELFARSFLNIADKCFYAPLVPLTLLAISPAYVDRSLVAVQFVISIFLVLLGLTLRHEALEVLDEIDAEHTDT